jgi:hypothetical protein
VENSRNHIVRIRRQAQADKIRAEKQEKYAIEQGVQITPMAVALGYGFHLVSDDARYVFSVNGVVKVLTRSIGRNVNDTSAVSSESEGDYGDEYERGHGLKSLRYKI